jgi:hypothetical protein
LRNASATKRSRGPAAGRGARNGAGGEQAQRQWHSRSYSGRALRPRAHGAAALGACRGAQSAGAVQGGGRGARRSSRSSRRLPACLQHPAERQRRGLGEVLGIARRLMRRVRCAPSRCASPLSGDRFSFNRRFTETFEWVSHREWGRRSQFTRTVCRAARWTRAADQIARHGVPGQRTKPWPRGFDAPLGREPGQATTKERSSGSPHRRQANPRSRSHRMAGTTATSTTPKPTGNSQPPMPASS